MSAWNVNWAVAEADGLVGWLSIVVTGAGEPLIVTATLAALLVRLPSLAA